MRPSSPPLTTTERALAGVEAGLGALQEVVVCCCGDRVVRYVNASAETFYGRPREDVVGHPLEALVGEHAVRDLDRVADVLAGELIAPYDSRHRSAAGTCVDVSVALSALRDDDGAIVGVILTVRDVAARVAIAQELARTRRLLEAHAAELERSNADLEQFAYVASHDLAEPLRTITGMLALLSEDYGGRLGDDADQYISRAVAGAERLRALIDALLLYSRVGRRTAPPVDADLGTLVAETVESLDDVVGAGVVDIRVQAPLPTVVVDPVGVRQVLQNLISNALKFNDDPAPTVEISAEREASGWRVVVADNGIGIPAKLADRVFNPFKRLHTRDAYPGTGIGLAICRRLVERRGGVLGHEPRDNGGTRFHFTIPDELPEAPSP